MADTLVKRIRADADNEVVHIDTGRRSTLRFGVTLDCTITFGSVTEDDLDALVETHLDKVMEELLDLDASDADIELDATNGYSVSFSVVVVGANPLQAIDNASGLIRTAIHAAGGNTPDWPDAEDDAWAVRLVAVRSAELVPA